MDVAADEVVAELSGVLGGTVTSLQRLSGGASRITSAFELEHGDGSRRPLILQLDRGGGIGRGTGVHVEASLLRAARVEGVPVPEVVAAGTLPGHGRGWLVVERLVGETIPRKILRDAEWAGARRTLTAQCGTALAAIHRIGPATIDGLPSHDPLRDFPSLLDGLGEIRPALELGARWLEVNRMPSPVRTTVHGDFRLGNLLVGPDGLRGVLDWELAHVGDPAEDVGWLCARSWRFGGAGRVGGFGDLPSLLGAYSDAGGHPIAEDAVSWWEAYAAVKWAVICALQAATHLSGAVRSMELAAIGRRICECEWDLFALLWMTPRRIVDSTPRLAGAPSPVTSPFGRPTASELVEAVREYLEDSSEVRGGDGDRFQARIARHALQIVERELTIGPALAAAHAERLTRLGFESDAALASALRSGALDADLHAVGQVLVGSTHDQLLVSNPGYLDALVS